jgi:hypothetical protein
MLLPSAKRRGEIHFYVAKSLPYTTRLGIAFALMLIGLTIQTALLNANFWIGLPFMFVGMLMLLTKGYQNRPVPATGTEQWRPAESKEVQRIIDIDSKQKAWDQDAVDITCPLGFGVFVIFIIALVGVVMLANAVAPQVVPMLIANGALLLLPFWLTGVRSILKSDKLIVKAKLLLEVDRIFQSSQPREGEEFQYQIATADTRDASGQVPRDVKAILALHDAPADFLGVQMQVSLNNVQGKDFPYFYCVLVARHELKLIDHMPPIAIPAKVTVEKKHEADTDIIVIRQATTKNSGYHTRPDAIRRIFTCALAHARSIPKS